MKDTQTVNMDTAIFQKQKEERETDEQSTGARHNLDSFHTRLRMLAKKNGNIQMLKQRLRHIIQSCVSSRLRRKALRKPELSLDDLFDHGRLQSTCWNKRLRKRIQTTADGQLLQELWRQIPS